MAVNLDYDYPEAIIKRNAMVFFSHQQFDSDDVY